MATNSSRPKDRNLEPPEASPALNEAWNATPSTESTAAEGHNAEIEPGSSAI